MRLRPARATRVAAAVVGLVLVGAAVSSAQPAAAYTDPAQLTITPGNPAAEDLGGLTFSGECPPLSDAAELRWDTGSGPVQLPVTLSGSGTFTGLGPYFTGAPPGLGLAVTLDCSGGGVPRGAAYEFAVYPDLGASISGSSTTAMDVPLAPSFDCGAAAAPSTFSSASVTLYDPSANQIDELTGLPVPSGAATGLGTPASYGLAAGDVVSLYLNCFAESGGAPFVAGYRSYTVTVTAAAPVAPSTAAPTPQSNDPELAATGIDPRPAVAMGALALILILLGAGLARRARRAA